MNIKSAHYELIPSANPLGKPITMAEAEDRIFGVVLMNDCKYYCTVLYCTVLYCTVLYCTVLYCTVLYAVNIPLLSSSKFFDHSQMY